MKPMLAGSIDPENLETYLTGEDWTAQQKLDGDRLLIHVDDGQAVAYNRDGEIRRNMVPRKVLDQFTRLPGSWVFDGELLDDLWLFDMPKAASNIGPTHPYRYRLAVLERFYAGWQPDSCVRLLPTARQPEAKRALLERVMANEGEGVVFRHGDAPYKAGKRSQSMLKAKFTKTADAVVTAVGVDGKANCHYAMFDNGHLVEVGSVSMHGKAAVRIGDVIELRYLYASAERRLYQPVMLRVRTDKAPTECTIDQLIYTNRNVLVLPDPVVDFLRQRRRNRESGTMVTIYDTLHPQSFLPSEAGLRWATVCEAHGVTTKFASLREARSGAAHPSRWCPECRS